jgi:hypothetical protein
VELELTPDQPDPVVSAIEALVGPPGPADPWWRAGLDEALSDET